MSAENQRNKAATLAYWNAIDSTAPDAIARAASAHLVPAHLWQGPAPYSELHGAEALATEFLAPLRRAIPDLKRQTHIFFGGQSDGRVAGGGDDRYWTCGTGYLTGTQIAPVAGRLADIPVTTRPLRLRWGEFLRFENGQIVQSQFLIDVLDWCEQIGFPLIPRAAGASFVYPAPTAYDGMLTEEHDDAASAALLSYARDFIFGGLNTFDRSDLSSMGLARFFHKNIKWYGPGGIGACLSMQEFEDFHQRPWLVAYPDRAVQDHDNLIAEDRLVCASSFPGVLATHTGPYRDVAATGNRIAFNGIDFWLKGTDKFTENWVFVDMVHLWGQFGIDLMGRLREMSARGNAGAGN